MVISTAEFIALLCLILVITAFAIVLNKKKRAKAVRPKAIPPQRTLALPTNETQRLIALSHLEANGIPYREYTGADMYRALVPEYRYVLVAEGDYDRAVELLELIFQDEA